PVVPALGHRQRQVAEPEKYPHVTYFFNGGEEERQTGERRELVPSPRDVATYDLKPEMSAREAAGAFVAAWNEDHPRFAIINFANSDMVGHTGVIPAAVRAVEVVDECLGQVVRAVHASGGVCIIDADHGNSDHRPQALGSDVPCEADRVAFQRIECTEADAVGLLQLRGSQQGVVDLA